MPEIWVPTGIGRSDFTEKKSRFLGEARGVNSAEEAREIVTALREEHPRSRHVVWAYILGRDGSLKGMSDDGEPHGTAGRPVLDHIGGENLTGTLVTVVRYYGGVKLGTGGLCSAYGRSAGEALGAMSREPLIERSRVELGVEYSIYEPILRLLNQAGGRMLTEDFGAAVRLSLEIPTAGLDSFRLAVSDASRGAAFFKTL